MSSGRGGSSRRSRSSGSSRSRDHRVVEEVVDVEEVGEVVVAAPPHHRLRGVEEVVDRSFASMANLAASGVSRLRVLDGEELDEGISWTRTKAATHTRRHGKTVEDLVDGS